jgi:hypothetical protein
VHPTRQTTRLADAEATPPIVNQYRLRRVHRHEV